MCEQTEVQYLEGNVVWVKLGPCWWPGEVQDIKKLPEEVQEDLRRNPIAAVKFFDEDKYEYVHKLDHICMYNCRRKMDFIKRGLDMYRTKKKEGSSFMDKFPGDVAKAEVLTGGDPQILSDSTFAPQEKTTWKDIFGEEKKPSSPPERLFKLTKLGRNSSNEQKTQSSNSTKPRQITHPRFLRILRGEESDHEVRIRLQPTSANTQEGKGNPYHCPRCDFTSHRLNVIILHNKYHAINTNVSSAGRGRGKGKVAMKADSSAGSSPGRGSIKGRPKQPQNTSEGPKQREYNSDDDPPTKVARLKEKLNVSNQKVEEEKTHEKIAIITDTAKPTSENESKPEKKTERKPIFRKRKIISKKDVPAKKKKTNEEIREKLLADWDDDDDEQEEQEMKVLKQVLNTSSKPENSTKAKEMSCFDFDESADSMLDTELEERAKKFAENLKFPRIIEDRDSTSKQRIPDLKQTSVISSGFSVKDTIKHPQKIGAGVEFIAETSTRKETKPQRDESINLHETEEHSTVTLSSPQEPSNSIDLKRDESGKDEVKVDQVVKSFSSEQPNNYNLDLPEEQRKDSETQSVYENKANEDLKDSQDLTAAFESVMAETAIPDLPSVPQSRLISREVTSPTPETHGNSEVDSQDLSSIKTETDHDYVPNSEAEDKQNFSESKRNDNLPSEVKDECSDTQDIKCSPESKSEIQADSSVMYVSVSAPDSVEPCGNLKVDKTESPHYEQSLHSYAINQKSISNEENLKSDSISEETTCDSGSVIKVCSNLASDEKSNEPFDSAIDREDYVSVESLKQNPAEVNPTESVSAEKNSNSHTDDSFNGSTSLKTEEILSESQSVSSKTDSILDKEESTSKISDDVPKLNSSCNTQDFKTEQVDLMDDDVELDINSMPVVMTDAIIKEEVESKESEKNMVPLQSVIRSEGRQVTGTLHSLSGGAADSGQVVSVLTPSSRAVSNPSTVLKVVKSPQSPGINVSGVKSVMTHKPGSKYVIIQQTSAQQSRYPNKPVQQCVTLKTVNQPQGSTGPTKKLVIMKTSQSQPLIQTQSVLTSSGKLNTAGQRVLTSSGAIVTAVPAAKSVVQKSTKLVSVPQQQIKVLPSGAKPILGTKLMMQSTPTKVSLPSMQNLQKVNLIQTSTGRIVSTTSKSKPSTILIHSSQSSQSVQQSKPVTITGHSVPRLQPSRSKQSSASSLQRVLLATPQQTPSQGQQQKLSAQKASLQPRMLVQRVQVPKSGNVVLPGDNVNKGQVLFQPAQVVSKPGQSPSIQKILPHPQKKNSTPVQSKGRMLTIQNTKQKIPAKKLQIVSSVSQVDLTPATQTVSQVQVIQQAVPVECLEQHTAVSESIVSCPSTSGTTAVTLQQSSTAGSLLTSEQLAQMMGASTGQINTEPGTLVLVTINEAGSLQPFDNSTLVAYDGTATQDTKSANALYIDSSSLGSQTDLDKLIFTINSQASNGASVVNVEQPSPSALPNSQCTVFNVANNTTSSVGSNQDILAAALANTDVFQPEVSSGVQESMATSHSGNPVRLLDSSILTVSSATLHQTTMMLPSLTTGLPPAAPGVLETSLTLNQPIMTPLEVPSAVTHIETPPPPPPSTSLQLTESSIVLPSSTYTSLTYAPETASSVESPVSSSTVVKALPAFQPSMPLLSEEVSETQSHEKLAENAVPPSSSLDSSQAQPEFTPQFESTSEGVTSSEISEKSAAQVPEISSHPTPAEDYNTVLTTFQQIPESTSGTQCIAKDAAEHAVTTSVQPESKDSSEPVDSSACADNSSTYDQQLDSTSEAVASNISDTDSGETKELRAQEGASASSCVESTSENLALEGSSASNAVRCTESPESTSGATGDLDSINTSQSVASSVWVESGNNTEDTGCTKGDSERCSAQNQNILPQAMPSTWEAENFIVQTLMTNSISLHNSTEKEETKRFTTSNFHDGCHTSSLLSQECTTIYKKDDIVWIKVAGTYRPGVVTGFLKQRRKVKVMIVNSTRRKNAYYRNFNELIDFKDTSKHMKLVDINPEIKEAYYKVLDYYAKKFNHEQFSALEYLISDSQDKSSVTDDSKRILRPREREHQLGTEQSRDNTNGHKPSEDDEDVVRIQEMLDSFGKINKKSGVKRAVEKEKSKSTPISIEENQGSKVIEEIKKSSCLSYLKKIFSGRCCSRRHKTFMRGSLSEKSALTFTSGVGPLDEKQVLFVYKRLLEYFDEIVPKGAVHNPNSYVFNVLMPEAVIFALKNIYGIDKVKAEKIFKRESHEAWISKKSSFSNCLREITGQ